MKEECKNCVHYKTSRKFSMLAGLVANTVQTWKARAQTMGGIVGETIQGCAKELTDRVQSFYNQTKEQ